MCFVLLRVGERVPGVGYPLEILTEEVSGAGPSLMKQVASDTLPDDLDVQRIAATFDVPDRDRVVDALCAAMVGAEQPRTSKLVGEHLYALLARGEVKQRWDELARSHVRFGLQILDDDLRRLPWELMLRAGVPVFANDMRPWSRLDPDAELDAAPVPPLWTSRCPLRILIIVGSAEADTKLRAEEEVEAIVKAIARSGLPVEWHVERRPPHERLRQLLRWTRPHVLHFIGHSTSEIGPGGALGEDALTIATPGAPWQYTTGLVGNDISLCPPALVVLNACRLAGSETAQRRADNIWTITRILRHAEVPAILAMQGDVRGADAPAFSAALYDELLVRGQEIDAAVAAARVSIGSGGLRQRDFGFPNLTLRCRPEMVLPLPKPELEATLLDYIVKKFRVEPFVDRCEERWQLAAELANPRSVLVRVAGAQGTGKTSLVRWCLYVHALLGDNVAYVDIERRDHVGDSKLREPLDILRKIREELVACPRHGATNKQHLDLVCLDDDVLSPHSDDAPYEKPVCDLRDALKDVAAKTNGVVVVLDHLEMATSEFRTSIGQHLVRPVADRNVPGVRLVVVVRDGDTRAAQNFPFSAGVVPTIPVGCVPKDEREPLATSLLYHFGWVDANTMARNVVMQDTLDWPMSRFELLIMMARAGGR